MSCRQCPAQGLCPICKKSLQGFFVCRRQNGDRYNLLSSIAFQGLHPRESPAHNLIPMHSAYCFASVVHLVLVTSHPCTLLIFISYSRALFQVEKPGMYISATFTSGGFLHHYGIYTLSSTAPVIVGYHIGLRSDTESLDYLACFNLVPIFL